MCSWLLELQSDLFASFIKLCLDFNFKVFDLLGKEVITLVNETKEAGYYTVEFDGSNFASGVYFYKLLTNNFVETKRMVLIK